MARSKRSTFGRIFRRKNREGYYVRVRVGAREVTRWAGPDRRTAEEFRADLLRKMAREDLLGERQIPAVTFVEFEPALREHFKARHSPTTLAANDGRLKAIVRWFGSTPLKDVTLAAIEDFLGALRNKEGLSPATVNRYASLLSVAFRLAVEKGVAAENPVRRVVRVREAQLAIPFLSSDDVAEMVRCARDPRFGALIRVYADTGLRRSEGLALEWRDYDRERGRLQVRKSKNRRPRWVDLTKAARDALDQLYEERTVPMAGPDLVWPEWQGKRPQAVSSRFRTVAKSAGFEALRLHDLRHGFCSRLAQAGVPLPTIGALAGHTSWQTTQRYASHIPDGATQAAIKSMERKERAKRKTRDAAG